MLGHWFFTNPGVHLKAAWEVLFMTGVGLLAFVFMPLIRYASIAVNNPNLQPISHYDTISRGQLFPFCFSMIGAVLWLQSREFKGKGIPARSLVNLVVYSASFICIAMYAVNPRFDQDLPPFLIQISFLTVLVFVLIRYFLIVVRDMPVADFQQSLQFESDEMTKNATARRGG